MRPSQGLIDSSVDAVARPEEAMPVSKKRKKDGKPVHRSVAPPPAAAAPGDPAVPVVEAEAPRKFGKPSNPFVARQSSRSAQRGR
jgi:hypothetical protein